MPLTLNVGLAKKIGQPDYGSLGASCNVQFELHSALLQTDLAAFHRQVRNAYIACQQAINDELARNQHQPGRAGNGHAQQHDQSHGNAVEHGNGHSSYDGKNGDNGHRASQKQFEYIDQLARRIRGLGVRRLETLAEKMFSKPVADLTSLDASGLIDCLKAIKEGEIDLERALNGATV